MSKNKFRLSRGFIQKDNCKVEKGTIAIESAELRLANNLEMGQKGHFPNRQKRKGLERTECGRVG